MVELVVVGLEGSLACGGDLEDGLACGGRPCRWSSLVGGQACGDRPCRWSSLWW